MSRNLSFWAEVPVALHSTVGATKCLYGDQSAVDYPEISIPIQYQRVFGELFQPEGWEGGKPRSYWGSEDWGLAKLDDWPAADAAAMLRRAIARLPEGEPDGDFWNASPGNCRRLLNQLLRITEWAVEHEPSGSWYLHSY